MRAPLQVSHVVRVVLPIVLVWGLVEYGAYRATLPRQPGPTDAAAYHGAGALYEKLALFFWDRALTAETHYQEAISA